MVALVMVLALLQACTDDPVVMSFRQRTIDVNQLAPYWQYHFQYNGSGEYWWIGPVATDAQKQSAVQTALNARQHWCNVTGAGAACLQNAIIGFRASVCPVGTSGAAGACDTSAVAAETGWGTLMARYAAENAALVKYLETHSFPVEYFRQTLEDIKTWQGGMNSYLSSLPSPKADFIKATEARLAVMADQSSHGDQVKVAAARQAMGVLDPATTRYQVNLLMQQGPYSAVAGDYAAYRLTEIGVFAEISAIAKEASKTDLHGLGALKVRLAQVSGIENNAPQRLIVDANRVQWALANAESSFEANVAQAQGYLDEHSITLPDKTPLPKLGMSEVVAYAQDRIRRANRAINTVEEGISRREELFSLEKRLGDRATADFLSDAEAALKAGDIPEAVRLHDAVAVRSAMQYTLDWRGHNHPGSCITPGLAQEGQANFHVNDLPIPTYTSQGSLVWGYNGEFRISYYAPFSGVLFRIGRNEVRFDSAVTGLPACAESDDTIYLQPSRRLLFSLATHGAVVQGATSLDLSLRELDPNLADALENLKRAIADADRQLKAKALAADPLPHLAELQPELDALLARGFDAISPADLDALLDKYADIPEDVHDALVNYLRDLKTNIAELHAEIARIASAFSDRVNSLPAVEAPGFAPLADQFSPVVTADPPPVSLPDVLGGDPWDAPHNPYAKYADEVLGTLNATVTNGAVTDRATFLNIYGTWKHNVTALEEILTHRSPVSVSEWGAFLDAKSRVLSFLNQFIDHDGWMRDAPVTPGLRAMIAFWKDLDASYRFKKRAEALQLAINQWDRSSLTPRQSALLDVLLAYDQAIRARVAQAAPQEREDGFWDKMEGIADGAIVFANVAVSFTPLGHLMDLCRAISGHESCWTGRGLSTTERVTYAVSAGIGGAVVWNAAAAKLTGAASKVAGDVGEVFGGVVMRTPKKDIVKIVEEVGGAKVYTKSLAAGGQEVRFGREGFPEFYEKYRYRGTDGKSEVWIEKVTGDRKVDSAAANRLAGFKETPAGYTWHHHEEVGRMQLIDMKVHTDFAHTGGVALNKEILKTTGGR